MRSPGASIPAGTRMLVTLAAMIIVLAGLKAAEDLLVPFVFAALVAILTAPGVLFLQSKKVPSGIAVTLVVLAVVVVLVGLGTLLGGSVNAFVASVPRYQQRLNAALGDYTHTLERLGLNISEDNIKQLVDPARLIDIAGQLVSQLAEIMSDTALIVLTVVFMLLEVATLPKKLRRAIGDPEADLGAYAGLTSEVKRYVVIKTYMSVATGVAIGVFLTILGVDFPLLWGMVAFLLNYIPNIGSIIAAVPPTLIALIQLGLGHAIGVATGFVVVNTVIGNVLEPRFMGKKLGLSALVVFSSLVFWGWLWGTMGMLLSVPLTMIVKILLENSGQFRSAAVLMDHQPLSQRPPPVDLVESVRDTPEVPGS